MRSITFEKFEQPLSGITRPLIWVAFFCSPLPIHMLLRNLLCITFAGQAKGHRPLLQDASWWPTPRWPDLCVGRRFTHQGGNILGRKCSIQFAKAFSIPAKAASNVLCGQVSHAKHGQFTKLI